MRVTMIIVLSLITAAGCGTGIPGEADVKKHMTAEQLALSGPITNSIGMVLVPIPAGEFQMGTAVGAGLLEEQYEKLLQEPGVKEKLDTGQVTKAELMEYLRKGVRSRAKQKTGPESPQHLVKITKPFFISSCEVTQQQFEAVMGASPWDGKPLVKKKASCAASYVTWDEAVEFCRKLSAQEKASYRLPTEAEWEYACRAQTQTTWNFGDEDGELVDYAWYDANAYHDGQQYPHRVGRKLPNDWALYDMHGNVWEWCQDWYAPYDARKKQLADPAGPDKGHHHVWRGGSFASAIENTRSATRLDHDREDYRPEFAAGFRIVREITGGQ
jgi:formylglycine-generating enzyme required for sulfatase activity